jgi:hypothetical protein
MNSAISNRRKSLGYYAIASGTGVALAISAIVAVASSATGSTPVAPSREASVLTVGREAPYETIQEYAGREQAVIETLSSPPRPLASDAGAAPSVISTEVANPGQR